MKEDIREKSPISLEKTGNIEIEVNELLRGNEIDVPTSVPVRNYIQNRVRKIQKIANKNMPFLKLKILRRETL